MLRSLVYCLMCSYLLLLASYVLVSDSLQSHMRWLRLRQMDFGWVIAVSTSSKEELRNQFWLKCNLIYLVCVCVSGEVVKFCSFDHVWLEQCGSSNVLPLQAICLVIHVVFSLFNTLIVTERVRGTCTVSPSHSLSHTTPWPAVDLGSTGRLSK